ncbi:5868_t:CDS:1 [Dentiscutata heterogama]|uniref:5868_t:CDS:1 n=1 Tax=Dentiscutata heterogama TaxID=1316150 RepID=A0ACA9N9S1_9GLOM|nr:5868_t:CDS:1 [Dentiscutata heterogama]
MPPIKSTKRTLLLQNFDQFGFKIKTVALRNKKNVARFFFLKLMDPDSSNSGTVIPENITIEDFPDQIDPWPNTNDFLIHFHHIYIVKYKGVKIYQMNFAEKIFIYRFPKNESVLLTGTHDEIRKLRIKQE